MPFLAAPLITTGISWGLSKLASRPSGAERNAQNNLNDLTNASKELALNSGRRGMSFLDTAKRTLTGPKNYFQSMLSGNPTEATTALAPDINRITGANQQQLQSFADLAPRGGGRGETLFAAPQQTQSQVQGLYNTVRPQAASSLADLGTREAAIGSSTLGSSGQFVYGATGGANSALNAEQMRRQREYETGRSIGSLLSMAVKPSDWSKILSKLPGMGGGSGGGGGLGPTSSDDSWMFRTPPFVGAR